MFCSSVLEILSIALIRRLDRKPKSTSTTQTPQYIKHFILNTEDIEIFSPQKWIECFDYLSIKNEKSEVFEIKPKGIVEFMIEYFIFDIKYLLYKLFK